MTRGCIGLISPTTISSPVIVGYKSNVFLKSGEYRYHDLSWFISQRSEPFWTSNKSQESIWFDCDTWVGVDLSRRRRNLQLGRWDFGPIATQVHRNMTGLIQPCNRVWISHTNLPQRIRHWYICLAGFRKKGRVEAPGLGATAHRPCNQFRSDWAQQRMDWPNQNPVSSYLRCSNSRRTASMAQSTGRDVLKYQLHFQLGGGDVFDRADSARSFQLLRWGMRWTWSEMNVNRGSFGSQDLRTPLKSTRNMFRPFLRSSSLGKLHLSPR